MSLPVYSEYKKTNVDWLTEVPAHWNIQSCRGVLTERNERNDPLINENYLSLMANIGIILYEEKGDVGNKKPEDLGKCKQVYPGDLVINSMNYGIGSYGLSKHRGVCSPVYIVLTPKLNKVEERYVFRILEIKKFQQYAQSFGNGILEHRASISWDILKNIGLPLPSIEEQRNILQFLDIEIAKIDNLVKDQEKMIELLKEKLQAVISNAVTKGLDPKVKMKDSGVAWLGDIPEHWELKKIKWCAKLKNEKTSDRSNTIALENIEGWTGRLIDTESEFEGDGVKFNEGDVLFGKLRPYLAKVFRATMKGEAIGDFFVLELKQDLLSQFAERLLISSEFIDAINSSTYGTKMPRVNWEYFSSMSIPLPPKNEQIQISNYLVTAIEEMNELIATSNNAVVLLEERRSALISAAVTGQIDVRNYQPKEDA